MSRRKNHTLIFLLLSSHLLGFSIIVSDDLHYGMPSLQAAQQFVAHDCGNKERHQTLDLNHSCVLCARSNNWVGYISVSFDPANLSFAQLPLRKHSASSIPGFPVNAPDRGPPFVVS